MNLKAIQKSVASISLAVISVFVFATAASAAPALSVTANGSAVTSMVAGDELNVSTSTPIPVTGASSQDLGLSWSGQSLQLKDLESITAPEGWSLQYSTDGTSWSDTAPNDLTTVVAVRSVGNINSKGGNKFQTSTTSTLVATQSNFQGSSGGDGYDLTFAGDRVYNVFHHAASSIQLDCHIKATGNSCFNAVKTFSGYATSNTSSAFWDGGSLKLYVMSKKVSTNEFGLACIDTSSGTDAVACSTPFFPLDDGVATTNALEAGAKSGDIVWMIDSSDYNLLCFNVATATACPDNQTTLPGTQTASTYARISVSGTKVWYNTYDKFGCYDTVSNANCGGTAPISITAAKQYPAVPFRNAAGTLQGFCLYPQNGDSSVDCLDSSNAAIADSASLTAFKNAMIATDLPTWNFDGAGQWAEASNKVFLNKGPSGTATTDVYCFDFTTGALCSGFDGTEVGTQIYSIHKDPSIPNCMWTNGNAGQITTFTATTGVPGCTLSVPMVEMPYDAITPRMSCDESGRVIQWDNVTFTVPSSIAKTDVRVTILDSNGSPVSGWTDRTIDSNGVLNMSTLTIAETGTRPTIQVSAGSVAGNLLDDITGVVRYKANEPELCVVLVAAATCPDLNLSQGDTSVPNGLIQGSAVTTPTSGSEIKSQTQAKINGSNTGAVCPASLVLLVPETLANTGGDNTGLLLGGTALIALGGALFLSQRRRNITE